MTHESLHEHLSFKFHVEWPRQNPMRYGNRDLCFFHQPPSEPKTISYAPVAFYQGRLLLGCGSAHGVHMGDEFAEYPLTTLSNGPVQRFGRTQVIEVQGLTSILKETDPGLTDTERQSPLRAKLLTRHTPWKAMVGIQLQIEGLEAWLSDLDKVLCCR